jgi:hypothetical protein
MSLSCLEIRVRKHPWVYEVEQDQESTKEPTVYKYSYLYESKRWDDPYDSHLSKTFASREEAAQVAAKTAATFSSFNTTLYQYVMDAYLYHVEPYLSLDGDAAGTQCLRLFHEQTDKQIDLLLVFSAWNPLDIVQRDDYKRWCNKYAIQLQSIAASSSQAPRSDVLFAQAVSNELKQRITKMVHKCSCTSVSARKDENRAYIPIELKKTFYAWKKRTEESIGVSYFMYQIPKQSAISIDMLASMIREELAK